MEDEYYMGLALELARSVKGQAYPNPPVAALLVKNGMIVGFGAHMQYGEAHAEVHALQMAGEAAAGATMYVTLEPCSHVGKTGPCCSLIIERKLSRVVIACQDPNEQVRGRGIALLKEAGIEVELGVLEAEAREINEVFFYYIQEKLPYVTLKAAVSLDGKIATVTGESKWITGEEARKDVHRYRHRHDAILVGVNTILKDDPLLTTRLKSGGKHPVRVILDHHLRTPLSARVIQNEEARTILFVNRSVRSDKLAPYKAKAHVEVIQLAAEWIEVEAVLRHLAKREIASVFVEGGARIHDSFLRSGFINQYLLYIAPKLLGGSQAPTAIGGKGLEKLSDAFLCKIESVSQVGQDIKIVAKRK